MRPFLLNTLAAKGWSRVGSSQALRCVSTSAFLESVEKVQQQLQSVPSDLRGDLVRHGRHLFETEKLDDLSTAFNADVVAKVCLAASQLRIAPVKSNSYTGVVEGALTERAATTMPLDTLARVVHSCLVLRSPLLYDALFTYARPLIARAGELGGVSVAVLLNAYGRAGFHHEQLYRALCDVAATQMKDARVSLPHVANVLHALSRVHFVHRPLLLVLRSQALRQVSTAPPIIAVTVLDAFSVLGDVDEELFQAYEQRVVSHLGEMQAPLIASFATCLARANRVAPSIMQAIGARILETIDTFDPTSIAKTCDAYVSANILSEEVFGALAERACKVPAGFRADEIHALLNCLSTFDLFDGELFPLLASRLVLLHKSDEYVNARDAAGVLASFAALQENNDELAYMCTKICATQPMTAEGYILALWSCVTLNIRNEAQTKLLGDVRSQPSLMELPPEAGSEATGPYLGPRRRAVLEERRSFLCEAYGIDAFKRH